MPCLSWPSTRSVEDTVSGRNKGLCDFVSLKKACVHYVRRDDLCGYFCTDRRSFVLIRHSVADET